MEEAAETSIQEEPSVLDLMFIYELGRVISEADHSVLKSCTNTCTGEELCVNIVEKGSVRDLMHTRRGLNIWKSCDHPNIMKLHNNYENIDSFYEVTNAYTGDTLAAAVKNKRINAEKECAAIIRDICGALHYLHTRGIVHSAVALRNIVFDSDGDRIPFLNNFEDATAGHMNQYDECETTKNAFLAPEICDKSKFTSEVDIWGLGICSYALLMGLEPCRPEMFQKSWEHVSAHMHSVQYNTEAKELVDQMVHENYSKRATAIDILCHPWIMAEGDPQSFDADELNEMCVKRRKELEAAVEKDHNTKIPETMFVYEMGRTVSQNEQSTLKTCTNKCTGREYCVNIVGKRSVRDMMHTRRGLNVWKSCEHPNIMKLENTLESEDSFYELVNKYAGSTVLDAVKNKRINGEKECATIIRGICEALYYLHSRGIVHCSVAPCNIAYDPDGDSVPYLINFEDATTGHMNMYDVFEGASNVFLAPEISDKSKFTSEVDIWGLGITLYTILMGFEPCHPEHFDHESWEHVSLQAKELIDKMVDENYSERASAVEVLCHPWIVGEGNPDSFAAEELKQMCVKRRHEVEILAKKIQSIPFSKYV